MGMSLSVLASTTDAVSTSGGIGQLLLFGAFFVAMYFLLVRPQRKRQSEQQQLLDGLEVGAAVVTIGGLHGVVDAIDEATVDLVVDGDGTVLRFARNAVASTITPDDATDDVSDDVSDDATDDATNDDGDA
ncbi:MAG: preprotein translocase subunit YajC [Myxococcota bacterium]|jgi:preprotein translocase subunit YajC